MIKISTITSYWSVLFAAILGSVLLAASASEEVSWPKWVIVQPPQDETPPEAPEETPPAPRTGPEIPYAPSPGRDDRTALPYVSHVFGLNDPDLPAKFSGIGPVFWDHSGQGTGALIAPTVVLTTGHLFAKDGQWHGAETDNVAPAPSNGRIYLSTCQQSYTLSAIHMGSMNPRARLGLDYAIVELAEPACGEAAILPIAQATDDLAAHEDQILIDLGTHRFESVPGFARHPFYAHRVGSNEVNDRYEVFAVKCTITGFEDTGDVSDGPTGLIVTDGCDGRPGSSGGAVVVSRDGGKPTKSLAFPTATGQEPTITTIPV